MASQSGSTGAAAAAIRAAIRAAGRSERLGSVFVTSHVLAGAVIGRVLGRHPAGAFAAGVISHFGMDACPHWGGHPEGTLDEDFLRVARCDGCAGLAAMAAAAGLTPRRSRWSVMAAMAGAAFPDLDKVSLYFFGWDPFPRWWRRFHARVQNEAPHRLPHEVLTAAALAALILPRLRRG